MCHVLILAYDLSRKPFCDLQKQKRQKVDKRDLPENNAYFCEVCDRGFKAEDLYTNHVNSHEKVTGKCKILL